MTMKLAIYFRRTDANFLGVKGCRKLPRAGALTASVNLGKRSFVTL